MALILRDLATSLTADSTVVRDGALKKAAKLEVAQRSVLARYVATQLRHQRTPERQEALAELLSGLADEAAVALTAAEELALMDPSALLPPVPFSLLAKHQPSELVELVRSWSENEEIEKPRVRRLSRR